MTAQVKLTASEMRAVASQLRSAGETVLAGANTVKAGGAELAAAGVKSTFGTTFTQKVDERVAEALKQKQRGDSLAEALDTAARQQDDANHQGVSRLGSVS